MKQASAAARVELDRPSSHRVKGVRGRAEPRFRDGALRGMLQIVATIFAIEFLTMLALATLSELPLTTTVLVMDAAVLAVVSAPLIYWVVRVSVTRQFEARRMAEARAAKLEALAITDELTEIRNRRGITIETVGAMAHAERHGKNLSVVLIDLDHFKSVNDTYGHDAGDRVLVEAASALERVVRKGDFVGRYGGEEFLIVLPETDTTEAIVLARRLLEALAAMRIDLGADVLSLTASAGLTELEPGESFEALVARADSALYRAKDTGRNKAMAAE